MSAVEISLLIDGQFGSSLPAGSLTLISLSSRLMGIALSTFAGAFSTVLYSHFSRITTYAPRRLSFYILESAKLMFWGTIPATIFLGFFSRDILYTIFYRFSAKNLTLDQISLAGTLLVVFSLGLFFYSVNKIFLSMYYAMHNTSLPMFITLTGVAGNILLNRLLMPSYGAVGLALATTSASLIQTALFVYCAPRALGVTLYGRRFFSYVGYYLAQLTVVLAVAYLIYRLGMRLFLAIPYGDFFISHIGLWLWVGPLCVGVFVVLYLLRNKGGMKLYFLE
jgi:putative peptidoglycan lipid II flippase